MINEGFFLHLHTVWGSTPQPNVINSHGCLTYSGEHDMVTMYAHHGLAGIAIYAGLLYGADGSLNLLFFF